jgi:catechol 2,3-dioxygenase
VEPFNAIDPRTRIGHVHLRVADLDRSVAFYRDVLGFAVTQRYGSGAVFLAAPGATPGSGYHHHIGLNTWESRGGLPPPPGCTGLYHFAVLYPSRPALADALRRLRGAGVPVDGASDHGVSEALYLRDPDGNGVELAWDRPASEWPRDADGSIAMHTRPLDLDSLLRESTPGGPDPRTAGDPDP